MKCPLTSSSQSPSFGGEIAHAEWRDVQRPGAYDLNMSTDTEIISRKLFSVEEFQRISDAGIFPRKVDSN